MKNQKTSEAVKANMVSKADNYNDKIWFCLFLLNDVMFFASCEFLEDFLATNGARPQGCVIRKVRPLARRTVRMSLKIKRSCYACI